MIRKCILLGVAICFISCKKDKEYNKIKDASWLIGRWENASHAGLLVEEWSSLNDSTLIGEGLFIVGKDTVFSEDLQLKQEDTSLTYVAKVHDQNNDKPVSFKMALFTKTRMIFENPAHDFPSTILYNLKGKDSLIAIISGIKDGKEANEVYRMKKK
jgi:uncharacterized protein DUF6265